VFSQSGNWFHHRMPASKLSLYSGHSVDLGEVVMRSIKEVQTFSSKALLNNSITDISDRLNS
jgi:hypothetical protein